MTLLWWLPESPQPRREHVKEARKRKEAGKKSGEEKKRRKVGRHALWCFFFFFFFSKAESLDGDGSTHRTWVIMRPRANLYKINFGSVSKFFFPLRTDLKLCSLLFEKKKIQICGCLIFLTE